MHLRDLPGDLIERHASLSDLRGQAQQPAKPLIPEGQSEIPVEDRDTLIELVEGGLKHVAIVAQRLAGLVEELL